MSRRWTLIAITSLVVVTLSASVSRSAEPFLRPDSLRFSASDLERGGFGAIPRAASPSRYTVAALRSAPRAEPGFVRSYLVPRLSSQLDVIAPRHPFLVEGRQRIDHLLYDDLVSAAQRRAERGAKKALTGFLLETTALGKLFGAKRRSPSGPGLRAADRPARTSSKLGIGISGSRPQVEWRYRAGSNSLRLRVTARGSAGLSFSRNRLSHTALGVGYNPDRDRYSVSLRYSF